MKKGNLFENIPGKLPGELVEILAEGQGRIRIERIVSRGHVSPPDFWYDQESTEWVTLLKGSARLRFEEKRESIKLAPGDWIEIPAHARHRVEETQKSGETVWLAIYWS